MNFFKLLGWYSKESSMGLGFQVNLLWLESVPSTESPGHQMSPFFLRHFSPPKDLRGRMPQNIPGVSRKGHPVHPNFPCPWAPLGLPLTPAHSSDSEVAQPRPPRRADFICIHSQGTPSRRQPTGVFHRGPGCQELSLTGCVAERATLQHAEEELNCF